MSNVKTFCARFDRKVCVEIRLLEGASRSRFYFPISHLLLPSVVESKYFAVSPPLVLIILFNEWNHIFRSNICALLPFFFAQLHLYELYVKDVSDLLRNSVKYFEYYEFQLKQFYEQKVKALESQLQRYQELGVTDLDRLRAIMK